MTIWWRRCCLTIVLRLVYSVRVSPLALVCLFSEMTLTLGLRSRLRVICRLVSCLRSLNVLWLFWIRCICPLGAIWFRVSLWLDMSIRLARYGRLWVRLRLIGLFLHSVLMIVELILTLVTLAYLDLIINLVRHLLVMTLRVEVPICTGRLPSIMMILCFLVVRPCVIVRTWSLPLFAVTLFGRAEILMRPSLMCSAFFVVLIGTGLLS